MADSLRRVVEEHRQAVGARLRALRKSKGWSQEDAAYNVGVTLKTWGDWERGKRDPYDTNWKKIGEAFDVDPADVRGTPPAPLGLGAPAEDDRLAQIEEALRESNAKLDAIVTYLGLEAGITLQDRLDDQIGGVLARFRETAAAPPVPSEAAADQETPRAT